MKLKNIIYKIQNNKKILLLIPVLYFAYACWKGVHYQIMAFNNKLKMGQIYLYCILLMFSFSIVVIPYTILVLENINQQFVLVFNIIMGYLLNFSNYLFLEKYSKKLDDFVEENKIKEYEKPDLKKARKKTNIYAVAVVVAVIGILAAIIIFAVISYQSTYM